MRVQSPEPQAERMGSSEMNKAFVRESDIERPSNLLPDRPIPLGPNLVTAEGLAHLERMIGLTDQEHSAAKAANDINEVARTERDLRYWTAQRATAQLMQPGQSGGMAAFGSTVRIKRDDGREQTFRIVGVDEADPSQGTLSHISPLAKGLLGKGEGDKYGEPRGLSAQNIVTGRNFFEPRFMRSIRTRRLRWLLWLRFLAVLLGTDGSEYAQRSRTY
jgi:transcription elongation GreA/GreB family factor